MTSVNCTANHHCTSGFCEDGVCKKPGPREPCKEDGCHVNYVCHGAHKICIGTAELGKFNQEVLSRKGLCNNSNAECPSTQYCKISSKASSLCQPRIQPGKSCIQIDSCVDGYICSNNACMAKCDRSGSSNYKCADDAACQKNKKVPSARLGICPEKPAEVAKKSTPGEPKPETITTGEDVSIEEQVTPGEGETFDSIFDKTLGGTFGETPGETGEGSQPGMPASPDKEATPGEGLPAKVPDPILQTFKKDSQAPVSDEQWKEIVPNIDVEALKKVGPNIRPEAIIDMVREPSLTPEALAPVIKDVKPEEVRPDLTPSYKAWMVYIAAKANRQVGKFSNWRPTRNQAIFGGLGLLGLFILLFVFIRCFCCRRRRQESGAYTAPRTTYQTSRRF